MTVEGILQGRLNDMLSSARDGIPVCGDFLDPAQQRECIDYLRSMHTPDSCYMLCGGYDDAERRMLFVLPDYMTDDDSVKADFVGGELKAIVIHGSGYEKLDHRSFLGALLSLGIERSRLGDIIVKDNRDACLFCKNSIAEFLLSDECPLVTVGRDHVKLCACDNLGDFVVSREFDNITDTIASARLDCVVAALCGLSREKTDSLIKGGMVVHNYVQQLSRSSEVSEKDIIAVRGYGKYIVDSIGTLTKKGRIRMSARKYK